MTTTARPNIVRRMYDWVLGWADSPYGLLALGLISFAEASFFPIPPDVLLIALVLGAREKWFKLALVCSLASVAGAILGYCIGAGLWSAVDDVFYTYVPGFTPEKFEYVGGLYKEWDFWLVFAAGFTPIPFKVITITAGVFALNVPMFLLASTLSRSARFFLVAFLLYRYGEKIRDFIDKRFNLLAILFTALLVGGFLVLKVAMK